MTADHIAMEHDNHHRAPDWLAYLFYAAFVLLALVASALLMDLPVEAQTSQPDIGTWQTAPR